MVLASTCENLSTPTHRPAHKFRVSINALFPGEKIIQGDKRHAQYHGAFKPETHTPETFLKAIQQGRAWCAELTTDDCGREHHGQPWCCKDRRDKGDPTHCGRPNGYRINWHFKSAQLMALDVDAGNPTLEALQAHPFIRQFATLIYPTISWKPEQRKWRPVFILTEPITDAQVYRKAATALLDRFETTDQQVKDPARLFFGMRPENGEPAVLGNLLPMTEVLKLVSEYENRRRKVEGEMNRRPVPYVDPAKIGGDTPDARYVRRAIEEERQWLASRPEGERHNATLLTTIRLESLRLSDWLAPEARTEIDTSAIVLEACASNGLLVEDGQGSVNNAIAWGIAHAEPRPAPRSWGQSPRAVQFVRDVGGEVTQIRVRVG